MLQKHLDKLVNGKKNAKIFVPLCTKSIDLKWLADQGHTVVGLEVAESCIQSFFKEQKLEFTVEMGLGGKAKIYKAVNHNIKLYVADFFDFNKEAEGQFDGVWDRRAMISLNKDQYPRYVALIKTLLAPDGRCLFVNADFDRTTCPGPYLVTHEMLKDLYKDGYKVEYVDERNRSEKDDPEELVGFKWFLEKMFLISKA
ncbi:thiopurine S-methyltransferase-like isoform X2 [Liolophura sinensis]